MPESRILCALDPDVGKALHGQGQLWHDAYYPELLDELGVCYDALPVQEAQRRLASHRVLVLTGFDASGMVGLEAWVRAGGTLIAFLTTGQDALFGIQGDRWRAQADDDFSIAAYMRLPDFKRLPGAAACE